MNEPTRIPPDADGPVVEWRKGGVLRSTVHEDIVLGAWALTLDGKILLLAVSADESQEAVTPENRHLIARAVADYMAQPLAIHTP